MRLRAPDRRHMRLTSTMRGEHHIPNHDFFRIGTLASILDGVAAHHGLTRDALLSYRRPTQYPGRRLWLATAMMRMWPGNTR